MEKQLLTISDILGQFTKKATFNVKKDSLTSSGEQALDSLISVLQGLEDMGVIEHGTTIVVQDKIDEILNERG